MAPHGPATRVGGTATEQLLKDGGAFPFSDDFGLSVERDDGCMWEARGVRRTQ